MKSIVTENQVFEKLVLALKDSSDTERLIVKVREAFELVYRELPLVVLYEISLTETERLRYTEFYQTGPNLSKYAIEIKGPTYCEYLWRDTGEWVLADEFYSPENIARAICKASLITDVPENVRELLSLLNQGCWKFFPEEFPIFGGLRPKDCLEVLSWDSNFLLVGTNLKNAEVVSRAEWDNLSTRETSWLH
jgi:hypothetical protein